jgi:hypothetical protein
MQAQMENNIKMDFREKDWESVDWIHLAQDRDQWRALVNMALKTIKGHILLMEFQAIYTFPFSTSICFNLDLSSMCQSHPLELQQRRGL